MNVLDIQMSSETASLKIWKQDSGTMSIPATSSSITVTSTIPHNFNSDNLIWQVSGKLTNITTGASTNIITPWQTGDGRENIAASLDSTNLYVTVTSSTVGSPTAPYTFVYYYRLLIP